MARKKKAEQEVIYMRLQTGTRILLSTDKKRLSCLSRTVRDDAFSADSVIYTI